MFQLTVEEVANLKSQSVTSSWGGRRRSLPWAFTEHGVAMLSTVLRSPRAISVSIEIVRAFVRLRRLHGEYGELARKIEDLESRYDSQFTVVFDAIRDLMTPRPPTRRPIGFRPRKPTRLV